VGSTEYFKKKGIYLDFKVGGSKACFAEKSIQVVF
jgi:hypothetical protein